MNNRKYELANEDIGRLLLRYSTPAVVAMFVNSLYNLVDTIFVGQGAGTLALAGLAIAFPIQMFILAIAQVVGIGSASIISRSLGAGEQRRAERTAGSSFFSVVVLSAALTVFGLAFLTPLLKLFGATEAVLPYAAEYLSVILAGSFFFAFAVSSNNIVRAEGNARLSMISMCIGAVTNVVLDPIFIFGLGMGIRGAAIATVIANVCATLFLIGYFMSGKSLLRLHLRDLAPYPAVLSEVLAIGSSNFARVAAGSVLAIVLNNSIAHYGGDIHLSILGVTNRVLLFFLLPLFGLVQGFQPIVGFNYGAQNIRRVKESLYKAIAYATVLSTIGFLVLMLFPGPVFLLFNRDPVMLSEGTAILRTMILFLPFVGFQVVGATLFQALGKAFPALFLSMSRQVLFLIPSILVSPLYFGLRGIWISFPVADLLSVFVTALWVLWQVKHLNHRLALER